MRTRSLSGLSDLLEQPRQRAASPQQDAILHAGLDVFLRDGFAATMDAVAAEAGVARRTVFNHFASKDELFEALLERTTATKLPKLTLTTRGDPRENLLDFGRRYVAAITAPDVVLIYRMLRRGTPRATQKLNEIQRTNYLRLRRTLAGYITRLVGHGVMKPVTPTHAAERFLASILGMARVEISLGFTPDLANRDEYIREAVDGFLDGVRV
jgi:TetR/AcrR family transcriptional regulator, mexJK operon transcriptional repressor